MPVFATTDLTAASYSVALFGLGATSVLLLFGTAWVQRGWKIAVLLCALATLIGVGADYEGRAAWAASGKVPIVYHYVGWAVSMPLQVIALYFFANQAGPQRIGLFWRLLIVSTLMVFVRYLGEAEYMHATLAFLIGLVFWLYIIGELFFGRMDEAVSHSLDERAKRGFFWLRLIVTIGWAIYPLGNFITSFSGYQDTGALTIAYNLADILNRMAFGVAVFASAALASEENSHV
jgi:bacteriorhodopsin